MSLNISPHPTLSLWRGLFLCSIKVIPHSFALWRRLILHSAKISKNSFSLEGEGWDEGDIKEPAEPLQLPPVI